MADATAPRLVDHDPAGTQRALSLFAGLPVDEIDQIVSKCDTCTAHPGQVIQAQDVPVRLWHVLLGGHVIVQRDDAPIGLLSRGDSWSEHSLLNRQRSTISVVALSPVTTLTLSERAFFSIPQQHPVLAGRLVARSAASADRLAILVFNALFQRNRTG